MYAHSCTLYLAQEALNSFEGRRAGDGGRVSEGACGGGKLRSGMLRGRESRNTLEDGRDVEVRRLGGRNRKRDLFSGWSFGVWWWSWDGPGKIWWLKALAELPSRSYSNRSAHGRPKKMMSRDPAKGTCSTLTDLQSSATQPHPTVLQRKVCPLEPHSTPRHMRAERT